MSLKSAAEVFSEAQKELSLAVDSAARPLSENIGKTTIFATTCLGLVYKDGVIAMADGQATSTPDLKIVSSTFKKIIKLDEFSVLAIAGMPGIAIKMAQLLRAQFSFDANFYKEKYLPPKSKVRIIANMIQSNMSLAFGYGLVVAPLFITFDRDPHGSSGRVFSILPPDGSVLPESEFEATGSGFQEAKSAISILLRERKKTAKDLLLDEAVDLAVYAVMRASSSDAGTGENVYGVYINADGVHDLEQGRLSEVKNRILERRD